jgi:hypothetical protein
VWGTTRNLRVSRLLLGQGKNGFERGRDQAGMERVGQGREPPQRRKRPSLSSRRSASRTETFG